MKAIIREKYGSPDILKLQDVDRPEPKENEVLVKILAASANKADWFLLTGQPFPIRMMAGLFKPKNKILGADISGVVERVGAKVTQFKAGDEVFGDLSATGFGGFAEYVAVEENRLAQKPASLSFEEAAALPMAGVTALQGLSDKGQIKPSHNVLINGASGGVGTFAVQIAKALGAEVTAVCSTSKVELAKEIGPDHVVDYKTEDYTKSDEKYDLIFDVIGNHSVLANSNVLKKGGRYVSCAFSPGAMILAPWIKMKEGKHVISHLAAVNSTDLATLGGLVSEGTVKPVIAGNYTLDEVPDVLKEIGRGSASGKLVVTL